MDVNEAGAAGHFSATPWESRHSSDPLQLILHLSLALVFSVVLSLSLSLSLSLPSLSLSLSLSAISLSLSLFLPFALSVWLLTSALSPDDNTRCGHAEADSRPK